jgi:ABC-type spermidine/putrescine transport system permease subunit I
VDHGEGAAGASVTTLSPRLSLTLLAPMLLLWAGLFVYPLLRLLPESLFAPGFTLEHYRRFFTAPLYVSVLWRTLRIATLTTAICLALGYPTAYFLSRLSPRWTKVLLVFVVLPLWTSVIVRVYAWMALFQTNGLVNRVLLDLGLVAEPLKIMYREGAVLVGMVHVLLPFMILPIYSVLRGLDPRLVTAAQNLGANGWQVFRRIVLPLSLPGAVTGTMFVFILSLGFYITPALLGGPRVLMVATIIDQQVNEMLNWPFAAAMATVLLVLTLGLVALFTRFVGLEKIYRAT